MRADTLVDNLTVEEMLLYTAEMKLEMDISMEEKRHRVEDLLCQLALTACRHVRIGSSMQRGISGTSLPSPELSLWLHDCERLASTICRAIIVSGGNGLSSAHASLLNPGEYIATCRHALAIWPGIDMQV